MNHSDSERVVGILKKNGMSVIDNERDADVVIINACSVRQKAIDRIWGKLREFEKLKKQNKYKRPLTVLTGCVLPADRPKFSSRFDLYFPIKDLPNLPQILEPIINQQNNKTTKQKSKDIALRSSSPSAQELLNDKQIKYNETHTPITSNTQIPTTEHYLLLKPKYENTFSCLVPIMTGCNAFCTYCAVPYTRGREVSRRPEEIITEIENLINKSCKEITLLGQIINKWMVKLDTQLEKFIEWTLAKHGTSTDQIPELKDKYYRTLKLFKFHHLLAIINAMQGDFWLRFTSSHPKWFSDELISTIARCEKIPNHVHLPVQSGSDTVLKRMLRPYTIEEYKNIIAKIKETIPGVAITTDCIVGFCGETEEEFAASKDLFNWVKYDMAFIAQYSPRPGTKAEQNTPDDVPHNIKKLRDKELTEILKKTSYEHNKKLVGKKVRVLVDRIKNSNSQSSPFSGSHTIYIGHTGEGKNIQFSSASPNLIGKFTDVTIIKALPFSLAAELTI